MEDGCRSIPPPIGKASPSEGVSYRAIHSGEIEGALVVQQRKVTKDVCFYFLGFRFE